MIDQDYVKLEALIKKRSHKLARKILENTNMLLSYQDAGASTSLAEIVRTLTEVSHATNVVLFEISLFLDKKYVGAPKAKDTPYQPKKNPWD